MTAAQLGYLHVYLTAMMSKISKECFKPGIMKLTLVARDPNDSECVVIFGDDDLFGVAKLVEDYAKREKQKKQEN